MILLRETKKEEKIPLCDTDTDIDIGRTLSGWFPCEYSKKFKYAKNALVTCSSLL